MGINHNECYRFLQERSCKHDGIFFVGVSSTRIYCRSFCPAKTPKSENCTFFLSAAAAEKAGYRPCLRCVPDKNPDNARIQLVSTLSTNAFNRIQDGALIHDTVSDLASQLGTSAQNLSSCLLRDYGASPMELSRHRQLQICRRLLTETNLSWEVIASIAGFKSTASACRAFESVKGFSPVELQAKSSKRIKTSIKCEIAYCPPLDWTSLLTFISGHSACGMEVIDGATYIRTVQMGNQSGWIIISNNEEKNTLQVEISETIAPFFQQITSRIKLLFDLTANPAEISLQLGDVAVAKPGLRLPGAFNGFEVAIRIVLGQQISVQAAKTIGYRLVRTFGQPIDTPFTNLTHLWPTPAALAQASVEAIMALGIVRRRAETIRSISNEIMEGRLHLDGSSSVEETLEKLIAIPGIGEWTAQCISMRALGNKDAFPHTDLGLMKALNEKNKKRILDIAEAWRPWRAYGAMHLWKSLDGLI